MLISQVPGFLSQSTLLEKKKKTNNNKPYKEVWTLFNTFFPFIETLFSCCQKSRLNELALVFLIFWPQMYPFPHNCNVLPSAKWLSYQWGKECCSVFYFSSSFFFSLCSLTFQGIPMKKEYDWNCIDDSPNVSFCLQHHQQFSKRFYCGCMCTVRYSENWVQNESKERTPRYYPISILKMEMKNHHSFTFPQHLYL